MSNPYPENHIDMRTVPEYLRSIVKALSGLPAESIAWAYEIAWAQNDEQTFHREFSKIRANVSKYENMKEINILRLAILNAIDFASLESLRRHALNIQAAGMGQHHLVGKWSTFHSKFDELTPSQVGTIMGWIDGMVCENRAAKATASRPDDRGKILPFPGDRTPVPRSGTGGGQS